MGQIERGILHFKFFAHLLIAFERGWVYSIKTGSFSRRCVALSLIGIMGHDLELASPATLTFSSAYEFKVKDRRSTIER